METVSKNINQEHTKRLSIHDKMALKITNFVGTMWCAYIFTFIAFLSFPVTFNAALHGRLDIFIAWLAQTFFQLVLLSIIMNGQRLDSLHSELRAENDFEINIKAEKEIESIQDRLIEILNNQEALERTVIKLFEQK